MKQVILGLIILTAVILFIECAHLKDSQEIHRYFMWQLHIQLSKSAYKRLLHKPYVNEVYLTGQNPPLKCCQHLEIQYTVRKRVDLLMLKILGL